MIKIEECSESIASSDEQKRKFELPFIKFQTFGGEIKE